jgi:hypothetical protein
VKLKSDTNFQAAKKKTPQERKKNVEMYAEEASTSASSYVRYVLDGEFSGLLGQQP